MAKTKWDTIKFTNYLNVDKNEINNLPDGLKVSTMCASCKLNTRLNIVNIENYLQLNNDDILTVKLNKERIRTLLTIKTKRPKKDDRDVKPENNYKKYFYNQITVVIRITHSDIDDINNATKINMKLFKNGSVQMSGCKTVNSINIALNKLIYKLKEIKAKIEDGTIVEKTFIEDPNDITVKDFKIDMINSNYKVNMQIDRDKFYNLLLKKQIKSYYEPCIRACVIIKYIPEKDNNEMKEISIFIFQKGNIIITGARSKSHILQSYNYINNILLIHTNEIIKKDDKNEEEMILNLYNDIMKDVEIGLIKL